MGPCVGRVILFLPPAPLSAAPTLNQLRLLGFSFLNSFSHGLAFSDVLVFSLQIIMGHNPTQMVCVGAARKSSETRASLETELWSVSNFFYIYAKLGNEDHGLGSAIQDVHYEGRLVLPALNMQVNPKS